MAYSINYIKKSRSCYTAYLNSDYGATSTDTEFSYKDLKRILEAVYQIELPSQNELKLYGKDKYKNEFYLLPKQTTIIVGKAEHSQLCNDLFWRYGFFDILTGEYSTIRWQGYNDGFWWNNVAPTDQARNRKGVNGRNYRIDFTNNIVYEVIA